MNLGGFIENLDKTLVGIRAASAIQNIIGPLLEMECSIISVYLSMQDSTTYNTSEYNRDRLIKDFEQNYTVQYRQQAL